MSQVLTSFLVGIGMETSRFDQGTKHIESSMGSLKSSILQTAGSLTALTALTGAGVKFAKTTSEIDNFTRSIGVGRSDLLAFGGALQGMGGDADSAMNILSNLEQKRASILTGDIGWIPGAAKAGINTDDILQASDSLDAFVRLSAQFQKAAPQQRLNMADALGLDPATVAFLSQGRSVVEATLNQYRDARPEIDGLTESSRELTQEWSRLEALAAGIGDKVESKMIPAITQATTAVGNFLSANKAAIDAGIDKYATPENIKSAGVAAAGAGLSTSGAITGALLQKVGMERAGALIGAGSRLAGGVGIAYGVADIAARTIDEQLNQIPGYRELDAAFTRKAYDLTGVDLSRGDVYEGTIRDTFYNFTPSESAWWPGYGSGARPAPVSVTVTPQPITVELDGQKMGHAMAKFTSDQNQAALDDLRSTTER